MINKLNFLPISFVAVLVLLGGLASCDNADPSPEAENLSENGFSRDEDTIKQEVQELPLMITYHLDSLSSKASVDTFKSRYSKSELEFILALNRIDENYLSAGDLLIIPDTLTANFLDYSPFPARFEMLDSIPKVVLISRRVQGFALYEHGELKHWGPVSSGKKSTPTPAGLFYGNYKALRKISTVDESWILPYYFNFLNFDGVGVHQYAMPGYPGSHACVRLRNEDAKVIYNWADQWQLDGTGQVVQRNGTPFMVFGDFNFDAGLPWLDLADHPNCNFLTAEEMRILKEYTLQYRKDSRNFEPPALPLEIIEVPNGEGLETVQ